ncbi:hypothetical protein CEV32_0655 [Brucella rhizosphaerae]|uniref:Uncharacterized protein n=1 Tax=Brucella rhizosphaerae TaxID=571254 RepID=A0A256FIP8_9HYPH|nr:hypothetical protein CEV32_0655 [Brucella rhizosphaerae]
MCGIGALLTYRADKCKPYGLHMWSGDVPFPATTFTFATHSSNRYPTFSGIAEE